MDIDEVPANLPNQISTRRQVWDYAGITPQVQSAEYDGAGTEDDPFSVSWIENDPRNPMEYSSKARWTYVMIVAACALLVSIDSSAYSGSAEEIMEEFGCGKEVFTLGLSLFVLGFAVGPIMYVHHLSFQKLDIDHDSRHLTERYTVGAHSPRSSAAEQSSYQLTSA